MKNKRKSKKILFTVTNDLSYDQRMIRICGTLARAGYEVLLLGRAKPNSKPLLKEDFQQKRLSCLFHQGKLFYLEYNLRLFFYLLFARFDAVCAIDLDTLLPSFLVGKCRRKIIVYDAHEYFTETPEVVRRPMVQRVWEMVARLCIPRIQFAYTVGAELQKILSARYQIPFGLIRNVPFARPVEELEKEEPPVILYQGALNEGRGIHEVLQAMRSIAGAQLWLVGEGDLSQSLRAECKSLGLEDRVIFKGYVSPRDLPVITAGASIGLNLLENLSLNYYYSLANKAFDYIQAGVPAIHMDFPEYRRLNEVWETAELIPDLNAQHIVKAIEGLLNDRERYQLLKKNCFAAAKDWTWEKESEQLLLFYRTLFKEK